MTNADPQPEYSTARDHNRFTPGKPPRKLSTKEQAIEARRALLRGTPLPPDVSPGRRR